MLELARVMRARSCVTPGIAYSIVHGLTRYLVAKLHTFSARGGGGLIGGFIRLGFHLFKGHMTPVAGTAAMALADKEHLTQLIAQAVSPLLICLRALGGGITLACGAFVRVTMS